MPGLVERMASLMCVDADCHEDDEDGNGDLDDNHGKMTAEEVLESEICRAKEMGNYGVKWLELEELDIDDDKLLALDLPSKCPVVLGILPLYFMYLSIYCQQNMLC